MKSLLNDLCAEYPEHDQSAREVLSHVKKLNDRINELERHPDSHKSEIRILRADYTEYYKTEIINSINPIIQKLYAE